MHNFNDTANFGYGMLFAILVIALIIFVIGLIIAYVISGLTYSKLAKKAGLPNPWLAWIPLGNVYLILQMTKLPIWLIAVPVANVLFVNSMGFEDPTQLLVVFIYFVVTIIWDNKLLEAFGENKSLAFLHLVPGIGSLIVLIIIMKMAFGSNQYLWGVHSPLEPEKE